VLSDQGLEDDDPDLWDAALRLAESWRALLAARHPDRRFEVICEMGYGPEVTFRQAGSHSHR
jgi:hypothetical protein